MSSKVVVLGAGGRTGAECVAALERQGTPVRAVVRDPSKYADQLGYKKGVEVVKGDVGDKQSLRTALDGCSGIIFAASGSGYWTAKDVDNQGVANVAEVAKELGGKHVVLVSSALVSPHNRWNPVRILLNNIRYSLMDEKFKGENKLRSSGVPYTIIRPGGLTNDPPGVATLVAAQGDKKSGRVSRSDVAAVCAAALSDPRARNVTLELTNQPVVGGPPPLPLSQEVQGLFAGLKPDTPSA